MVLKSDVQSMIYLVKIFSSFFVFSQCCSMVLVCLWMSLPRAIADEPTNAAEAAAKSTTTTSTVEQKYRAWRATLSPERQQWEGVLEANLGSFYFPAHMKDKAKGIENAWAYVEDVPRLPRVLLIGDSISRGYTQGVRKCLAGKANVHRAPANCGPTATGLKKLSAWLEGGPWDVIHFNFGIHDRNTADAVYADNLTKLVAELEKTGAKLVWATTTATLDANNHEGFSPSRCVRLNEIATEVMKRHDIVINDLNTFIQPHLTVMQKPGNVHFLEPGYEMLAEKVAVEISNTIASLPNPPRPIR